MKAVITGGAMGIGFATAAEMKKAGYEVWLLDVDEAAGRAGADKLGAQFLPCDVSRPQQVDEAAKRIGSADVLVCNAAVQTVCPWDDVEYDDFGRIVDVNLKGSFYTLHAFSRDMCEGGRIIVVSSVHGVNPRLQKFAYDASKAALNMMTKEAALALAPRRITVNCVALGATYTPMNAVFDSDKKAEAAACAKIPLGRICDAGEVGRFICALTGSAFSYMTGSVVNFDGGRSLV